MSEGALSRRAAEGLHYEFKSWQLAFGSANTWQRDYWLMDWMKALNRLEYLKVLRSTRSLDDYPMLEILGKYDIYRRNTNLVQLDLATLMGRIAGKYKYIHAFRDTSDGFDFLFIVHNDSYSLSGAIRLACTR